MSSSIEFNPPLLRMWSPLFIRDFYFGNRRGKGAGGRGYPGAIQAAWIARQREAIVELENFIPEPQIMEAKDRKQTFKSVTVITTDKQFTMHSARIGRFTRFVDEPAKIHLEFEHFTTTHR